MIVLSSLELIDLLNDVEESISDVSSLKDVFVYSKSNDDALSNEFERGILFADSSDKNFIKANTKKNIWFFRANDENEIKNFIMGIGKTEVPKAITKATQTTTDLPKKRRGRPKGSGKKKGGKGYTTDELVGADRVSFEQKVKHNAKLLGFTQKETEKYLVNARLKRNRKRLKDKDFFDKAQAEVS